MGKYIDKELGLQYCLEDEIYREILGIYCEEKAEKIVNLNQYLEEKDWNQYAVLIHAVKSNSLNIGCQVLFDEALALEKASKAARDSVDTEQNISYICENHKRVMQLFEEVVNEAEEYLAN